MYTSMVCMCCVCGSAHAHACNLILCTWRPVLYVNVCCLLQSISTYFLSFELTDCQQALQIGLSPHRTPPCSTEAGKPCCPNSFPRTLRICTALTEPIPPPWNLNCEVWVLSPTTRIKTIMFLKLKTMLNGAMPGGSCQLSYSGGWGRKTEHSSLDLGYTRHRGSWVLD